MNYRAELVRLIAAGTPPPDIIEFFIRNGFHPLEVDILVHECGVRFS